MGDGSIKRYRHAITVVIETLVEDLDDMPTTDLVSEIVGCVTSKRYDAETSVEYDVEDGPEVDE